MANKISPHLWYTDKADEAAAFYASIFSDSRVDSVSAIPADTPSGPAGSVKVVELGRRSDRCRVSLWAPHAAESAVRLRPHASRYG